VRKAKKNSLKDATDPVESTTKDELQFLREITGAGEEPGESIDVRKTLFLHNDTSSLIEDKVDEKIEQKDDSSVQTDGRGEENENAPFVQKEDDEDAPGRFSSDVRIDMPLTEETAKSVETSLHPDLGTRLGASIDENTLPPESEEKTEVEPLSYEGPGYEETTSSYRVSSQMAHSKDDFNMDGLRKALSQGEKQQRSYKVRSITHFQLLNLSHSRSALLKKSITLFIPYSTGSTNKSFILLIEDFKVVFVPASFWKR